MNLISQSDFARQVGITRQAVCKLSRGRLSGALIDGRIDLDAPCVVAYLTRKMAVSTGSATVSFEVYESRRTGVSVRTIQRYLQIATGITPGTKKILRGTWLENSQWHLLQLTQISDPDDQAFIATYWVERGKKSRRRKAVSTDGDTVSL